MITKGYIPEQMDVVTLSFCTVPYPQLGQCWGSGDQWNSVERQRKIDREEILQVQPSDLSRNPFTFSSASGDCDKGLGTEYQSHWSVLISLRVLTYFCSRARKRKSSCSVACLSSCPSLPTPFLPGLQPPFPLLPCFQVPSLVRREGTIWLVLVYCTPCQFELINHIYPSILITPCLATCFALSC